MGEAGKTVHIAYYAILRDQRGCSAEDVTTQAETAHDLYAQLQQEHGLSLQPASMQVAVNGEFVAWGTPLNADDEVVFIPPVAGG